MIVLRSCFATKLNLYILLLLLATLRLPAQTTLATLSSPLDYQVFQRRSRQEGTILIRGRASVPADRVEARIVGQSLPSKWKRLTFDSTTGDFRSDTPTPAGGFYTVEVKLLRKSRTVAELTVPHVGVGEVFLISGQSNSTNYGEVPQTTETGMVTTFSGEAWRLANDPQPGTQDNSKKGSFAPSFGDALYRKYHVPIGIASVGHGSTSVRQWLPTGERVEVMPTMTKYILKGNDGSLTSDGTLFNGMMARIHQLGPHGFAPFSGTRASRTPISRRSTKSPARRTAVCSSTSF